MKWFGIALFWSFWVNCCCSVDNFYNLLDAPQLSINGNLDALQESLGLNQFLSVQVVDEEVVHTFKLSLRDLVYGVESVVENNMIWFCFESSNIIKSSWCRDNFFPEVKEGLQKFRHQARLVESFVHNFPLNQTYYDQMYKLLYSNLFSLEETRSFGIDLWECFNLWNDFDKEKFAMFAVHYKCAAEKVILNVPKAAASVIHPVEIPRTIFLEYIVYKSYFRFSLTQYTNMEYVGVATYRTLNGFAPLCANEIRRLLAIGKESSFDVIPLVFHPQRLLMVEGVATHTRNFKKAWDLLLQSMGYELATIRKFDMIRPFYRNSMLIKPAWLRRLSRFMSQAIEHALFNETVNAALSHQPSRHGLHGKEVTKPVVLGADENQLFAFVFERLPAFYLHTMNATVYYDTALVNVEFMTVQQC